MGDADVELPGAPRMLPFVSGELQRSQSEPVDEGPQGEILAHFMKAKQLCSDSAA